MKRCTVIVPELHCTSCEKRVETLLASNRGVKKVNANYVNGTITVDYDPSLCDQTAIIKLLVSAGYTVKVSSPSSGWYNMLGMAVIFAVIVFLSTYTDSAALTSLLTSQASYVALFTAGLLASLHCAGMCGGIMLSQCVASHSRNSLSALIPNLLYNLGRLTGYSILGGMAGALGSVFSLSIGLMSGISIIAGLAMIIMGIHMTGFTFLGKRLSFALPQIPYKPKTPFLIGVLNGLMPCGPLQTMQLYALGTASVTQGALSMFIFALGTMPLMLSFGALAGFFSATAAKKVLKLAGVCVIVLGIAMTGRGLTLGGFTWPWLSSQASAADSANLIKAKITNGVQTIHMKADSKGYTPNVFFAQKNIPIRFVIQADRLTSCNNEILIPDLKIRKKLIPGENVLEIPPQTSDIAFSCWMGMLKGVIKLTDDLAVLQPEEQQVVLPAVSPACCRQEINPQNSVASIYGNDLSKVSPDRLIHKAQISPSGQTAAVKAIGVELEPLVLVVEQGLPANITFDVSQAANSQGLWEITNLEKRTVLSAFTIPANGATVPFTSPAAGKFGIFKDKKMVGLLIASHNIQAVNPAELKQILLENR